MSALKSLLASIAFASLVFSQQPPVRLVSPEVHPDQKITFRLRAPKAAEVLLRFEGSAGPQPMSKSAEGVWSITVGPVEPEIYGYSFDVDGLKVLDLGNNALKVGATIDNNLVEVPGTPPRFDQVQEVAHGSVNIHTYAWTATQLQRGLYVYAPPDYYAQPSRRFPVLYLFHGAGDTEQDWSREGRAGVIMDNLIAQKKVVPMIVVMPNNASMTPAAGALPRPGAAAGSAPGGANYALLKQELHTDIIPFIANHYRTVENRENRAIAGLSAGGGTAINVGLASLDTFAWVAEFSSGMFGGTAGYAPFDIDKISPGFYKDPTATNKRLKLLYMSCGTEDPRMPFQKKQLDDFQSHQIKVTFAAFPGAHVWKVWRHSLADLAPKLFR